MIPLCADSYNFCIVPLKGQDAFLFVSIALLAAAILFGKLSAVWVLVVGECWGAGAAEGAGGLRCRSRRRRCCAPAAGGVGAGRW